MDRGRLKQKRPPVQAAGDMIKLEAVAARQAVGGVGGIGVAADSQHIVADTNGAGGVKQEPGVGPPVRAERHAV